MSAQPIHLTPEEIDHDLVADLRIALSQDYGTGLADDAWPLAIRRALWAESALDKANEALRVLDANQRAANARADRAEAEVERLRRELESISPELRQIAVLEQRRG